MFAFEAKARASGVNDPDETTNPPAAPLVAITPLSSRTVVTPIWRAFHCLHWTKNL
jgi:hypothetical protein